MIVLTMGFAGLTTPAHATDPFALQGTQPYDLAIPLEPVENCENCHAGFQDAPIDTWKGTMMANAFRDPLYLAAVTIANQDVPESGNFCLRCHVPNGWLEGRCVPGDGSALTEEDINAGVGCDVCHRMFDEGLAGNAQYSISDTPNKVGLLNSEFALHSVVQDPYLADGDLCGVCHEVSNPALNDFPIELTWTEWSNSAFKLENETCQDCHMKEVSGYAANQYGVPVRNLHVHRFVGGNTWIPQVLAAEYPELDRAAEFAQVVEDARALHHEASTLAVQPPDVVRAGSTFEFTIRAENRTGHKLPTGYPEGRRAWLSVDVTDGAGNVILASGAYDRDEATLVEDEQLRTYQALLGSGGIQSYHMVEQNELLEDTRIPPRGFRAQAHTLPVGREFATQPDGTLAHWDDAPYSVDIPADAIGPITVSATLWYQTTTRAFVTFLRDENVTDDYGDELYRMWETYGKAPPEELSTTAMTFELSPPVVIDPTLEPLPEKKGCGCGGGSGPAFWWVAAALLAVRHRRRA